MSSYNQCNPLSLLINHLPVFLPCHPPRNTPLFLPNPLGAEAPNLTLLSHPLRQSKTPLCFVLLPNARYAMTWAMRPTYVLSYQH